MLKQDLKKKYLRRAQSVAKRKKKNKQIIDQSLSEWSPAANSTRIDTSDIEYHSNVNRELKRLLLASVGSDLQQELDGLVQEKTLLKQNLDISLHHLMECSEEMDQLTVECDIWRSKVLASRVLIDELTKWKMDHLKASNKCRVAMETLLKEREELCGHISHCHQLILKISNSLMTSSTKLSRQYGGLQVATVSPVQLLPATEGCTIVEVAKNNCTAAEIITEKLQDDDNPLLSKSFSSNTVPTVGEELVKEVLYPVEVSDVTVSKEVIPHLSYREKHLMNQRRPLSNIWSTDHNTNNILHYCPNCTGRTYIV